MNSSRILLTTHKRPDGDAIGSILALYRVLKNWGKQVEMANVGPMPWVATVLADGEMIADGFRPEEIDTVVILDCADWPRTGFFDDVELKIDWPANLIVIDHHAVSTPTPGLHLIRPEISSTCELLATVFDIWGVSIDAEIATCLWAGMVFDTFSFQHSSTSEQTLAVAARLLAVGADTERVAAVLPTSLSPVALSLWGRVLSRMELRNAVLVSWVSLADLGETGAKTGDIEGLVALMNRTNKAQMAMLAVEVEVAKWKVSLRTERDDLNVAQLAKSFGGGGHAKAAGFEYSLS